MIVVFFSPPVMSDSATPWTTACQASLSLTISQSLPKFLSVVSVIPSSHLILWCPFSFCPQSFPASGTFLMSWLFTLDDQNTGASASASLLPRSIQGLFPLRLIGLISFLSKGPSGVFSSTTVEGMSSLAFCLLYGPALTKVHDHWEDTWIFVGRVMSLIFNTLSRFVVAFLPRSNHLLISWMWSPTTVILEAKKRKFVTNFPFSLSICHEVVRPDAMILFFFF